MIFILFLLDLYSSIALLSLGRFAIAHNSTKEAPPRNIIPPKVHPLPAMQYKR